jgi:predicted GNAT family acetyltransferase
MKVGLTNDAAEFRAQVFEDLRADPVLNTVMLGAVASWADGTLSGPRPATFARLLDDDGTLLATAMRTPPYQIGLMARTSPEHAVLLADTLVTECGDATGVHGSAEAAAAFAERWQSLTGRGSTPHLRSRLYRLGTLTVPAADGVARAAGEDDLPMARDWYADAVRVLGEPATPEQVEQTMRAKIAEGTLWFWYDGDWPVSMVGYREPQYGVSRVGPVFTPEEFRNRGYASALTAHVSRVIRDSGADACLFTDLANPTSNKIYAAIGYEPVADFVAYRFAV